MSALLQRDPEDEARFASQYGAAGDAEQLIRAHRAALPRAVRAASLQPRNEDEAGNLNLDDVEPQFGGEILDATVRGDHIVFVELTPDGRTRKGVQPLGKQSSRLVSDKEQTQDDLAQARAQAESGLNDKVQEIEAKYQEQLAELREEMQQELSKAVEKEREASRKEIEKLQEEAAKASESTAGQRRGPDVNKSDRTPADRKSEPKPKSKK